MARIHGSFCWIVVLAGLCGLAVSAGLSDEPKQLFKVTIKDDKPASAPVIIESTLPIENGVHAQVSGAGGMGITLRVNNQTMHLGLINTVVKIDNQVFQNGKFGGLNRANMPLPKKPGGKARIGFMSVSRFGQITITQTVEVVPTLPAKGAKKRRLDSIMVTYQVENKDNRPHQVGLRVWFDVFIVNNDGALFAAPNKPGKILDGVELKDKDVPDYLQFLQVPNLRNPGFVAHMTYDFGKTFERPNRVILTNLGGAFNPNGWDMGVMQAGGDSAMGFYWDPKEVAPGKKRMLAYGYGQGICPKPQGDGEFNVALGGSFEPGKVFTIAAYVQDPFLGQTLTLELPDSMERVEGKIQQPVPAPDANGNTLIMWKARVLRTGEFKLRVRSRCGISHGKIINVTR
jgi:hypothetical protein